MSVLVATQPSGLLLFAKTNDMTAPAVIFNSRTNVWFTQVRTVLSHAARGAWVKSTPADRLRYQRAVPEADKLLTASAVTAAIDPEFERLHPRGRDGEFIEKGGIVKIFQRDRTKPPLVGQVDAVANDGSVNITLHDGSKVNAKPSQLEQSDATARLDGTSGSTAQTPGSQDRPAVRADDKRKTQGQTTSNFVDPDTGQPMTKTAIGDTFEKLFQEHAVPVVMQRFGGEPIPLSGIGDAATGQRTARNTPLDFQIGQHGVELKTISSRSKNQKTAIKKDEVQRKRDEVNQRKLKPLLLVQVVDQDTGQVHVYAYNDFASVAVARMELVGSYDFDADAFRRAKQAAGADKPMVAGAGWTDETDAPIEPGDTVVELSDDGVPIVYTEPATSSPAVDTVTA